MSSHLPPRQGLVGAAKLCLAGCLISLLPPALAPLSAQTFSWDGGGGNGFAGDELNWAGDSGFPNGSGQGISVFNTSGTIYLADAEGADLSLTLSSISANKGSTNMTFRNVEGGVGSIILQDDVDNVATISAVKNGGKTAFFYVDIVLNSDLFITSSGNGLRFYNPISSGSGLDTGMTIGGRSGQGNTQNIGWVFLDAAASYTGETIIQGNTSTDSISTGGGKLQIQGDNYLPTATILSVDGSSSGGNSTPQGGRLNLNGFNQQIAGLKSGGGIDPGRILNDAVTASVSTLTINNSGDHTYDGLLVDATTGGNLGTLALTKTGTGTQTLTGVNTYTGSTNVSEGVLEIAGEGSINGTSGVLILAGAELRYNSTAAYTGGEIVADGGTLSGEGPLAVAVTLDSTADTLAPGNSPGIQEFMVDQTWSSFTYEWEINDFSGNTAGTDFDQISLVDGTIDPALVLDGGPADYVLEIISLDALNAPGEVANFGEVERQWTILTAEGGITGFDAAGWTIDASGFQNAETGVFSLSADANNIYLNYSAVPEPSAALLISLAAGTLATLRRRRR